MDAVPLAKWGALLASLASAVLFVSLLPVFYFAFDHLVWKGLIPSYHDLPVSRQEAFRSEWDGSLAANPHVHSVLVRLGLSEDTWESRWQASIYEKLRNRVGPETAETYLALPAASSPESGHLTGNRLGLLSL